MRADLLALGALIWTCVRIRVDMSRWDYAWRLHIEAVVMRVEDG
jgi:hypothetical protein